MIYIQSNCNSYFTNGKTLTIELISHELHFNKIRLHSPNQTVQLSLSNSCNQIYTYFLIKPNFTK